MRCIRRRHAATRRDLVKRDRAIRWRRRHPVDRTASAREAGRIVGLVRLIRGHGSIAGRDRDEVNHRLIGGCLAMR
jgi:hypothetical protein